MMDAGEVRALVARAMAGDAVSRALLVETITPIVRARVARTYARRVRRSAVNDVDDLVQETFAMLFRDDGRALRAWDPDRGLPFLGFVGLLAQRAVGMTLRASKRDPWLEVSPEDDTLASDADAADRLEARDELRHLFARARERLTGTGWSYLIWLVLEHRPVQDIARTTGTTLDAIYTWNTRIKRLLHEIRCELDDEGRAPIQRAGVAR
jgi:DNA-directed RNA polymerase specialized sigma24 family protein